MMNNTMSDGQFVSLTSTSQNMNAASKTDMIVLSTQAQALPPSPAVRIPGMGKAYILHVAPDFDAPVDFGV